MTKTDIDRIAKAMREALSVHQGNAGLLDWSKADPEAKAEWRVCAKAAIETVRLKQ